MRFLFCSFAFSDTHSYDTILHYSVVGGRAYIDKGFQTSYEMNDEIKLHVYHSCSSSLLFYNEPKTDRLDNALPGHSNMVLDSQDDPRP